MLDSYFWKVGDTLEEAKKQILIRALQAFGNNKQMTCNALGISRRGLDLKMERYGLKDVNDEGHHESDFENQTVEASESEQGYREESQKPSRGRPRKTPL